MIDTIKIISMINHSTYKIIEHKSKIKTAYNKSTGEIYYTVINDSIGGSYNSNISVRVGVGTKYNFVDNYYIEIERFLS